MNLTKADALQDEAVRDLFSAGCMVGGKPFSITEQTYIETSDLSKTIMCVFIVTFESSG